MLAKDLNEDISNINFTCAGINHMAFFLKFEKKQNGSNIDLYPKLKILADEISKSIISLEKQIQDIKDDVSNLYSLYTSSDFNEKKIIGTSDQLNIEESSSNIVENSEDNKLLGQISLSDLEGDEAKTIDLPNEVSDETISSLSLEKEELEEIEIKSFWISISMP